MRIKLGYEIVGCARVFHLENVALIAEHSFAIDDRTHGTLIKLVALDDERGVNRADPKLPAQGGTGRQRSLRREHTDQLRDLHAEGIDNVSAFE